MPERTFDLDDAFAGLTADVEAGTRSRGADAAIRTSRRRRTAVVGSLAAGTLAVAAVIGGTIGLPTQRTAPPVAGPARPTLPTGTPATPDRLQQASAGWAPAWTEASSPVLTDDPCLDDSAKLPDPTSSRNAEYRLGDAAGAGQVTATFADAARARAAWDALRAPSADCAGATITAPVSSEADGVAFASITRTVHGNLDSTTWYAVVGNKLAILTVAGVEQDPPAAVISTVSDVLLADLNR